MKAVSTPPIDGEHRAQPADAHAIGAVTGLQVALDNKAAVDHNHDATYLKLVGGTLSGQLAATQTLGTATPRLALTNNHDQQVYGQGCLRLVNAAAGLGIDVANSAGGWGIAILNSSTGQGINISNTAGGYAARLSNSAASTQACLRVTTDSTNTNGYAAYLSDKTNGTAVAALMQVDHYSTAGYAANILNRPGAASAFVIHQYSEASGMPAAWIDNCGNQPALRIWNTENPTNAPGTFGTGWFLDFQARPATGEALAQVFYVAGDGTPCLVPKAADPTTPADGMMWVTASGDLKIQLGGATKTVTVS